MHQRTFFKVAAVIFLLIAVFHALRLIYGWDAVIGGLTVPLWVSGVGLVIAAFLTYHGFQLGRR